MLKNAERHIYIIALPSSTVEPEGFVIKVLLVIRQKH